MSAAGLAAALLAACAVGLTVRGRSAPLAAAPRRRRPTAPLLLAVLAAFGALLVLGSSPRRIALIGMAGLVALAVTRALARRRRAREADRRADLVLEACEGVSADLRVGQPPTRALERAAQGWPELWPVVTAARVGADVPDALRTLAASPGGRQLVAVAAAWEVAQHSGTGLADTLGQVVVSLRQRRRTVRLVTAEVASARATAMVLALLPLGMLALGSGVGGDPLTFLVDSVPGLVCLGLGLGLTVVGWWWLDRIADGVLDS